MPKTTTETLANVRAAQLSIIRYLLPKLKGRSLELGFVEDNGWAFLDPVKRIDINDRGEAEIVYYEGQHGRLRTHQIERLPIETIAAIIGVFREACETKI